MTFSPISASLLLIVVYCLLLLFFTNKRIDYVTIENEEIISLVRKINPNKATGSDGISGKMLLLCDDSVSIPLQIIYSILIYGNLPM